MKKEVLIFFGQKVRTERLKLNLSQENFASKVGVHRTYVGMIERGEKNITLDNIDKICLALNLTISEIFKGYAKQQRKI
jgi:transcriptional regulator with XRE-family HTH domain